MLKSMRKKCLLQDDAIASRACGLGTMRRTTRLTEDLQA